MMRLTRVEMLRLRSRRLVRVVGALVLLLIAVIVTVDGYQHSNESACAASLPQFAEVEDSGPG